MLASLIVYGLDEGTFDLNKIQPSVNTWIFLGFAVAFAIKAPLFPFHGWLPDAYRKAPPEVAAVLSGVVSKTAVYGFLRIAIAKFPGPVHDFRVPILVLATIGLLYGSLLAFRAPDVRGVIAYSSLAQMGLITLGLFAANDLGFDGAILQSVNHGLVSAALFLLAAMVERRTSTGELRPARRDGARAAAARDRPDRDRRAHARGAVLDELRRASSSSSRASSSRAGPTARSARVAMVLAAMYALRLISAVLHREPGQRGLGCRPRSPPGGARRRRPARRAACSRSRPGPRRSAATPSAATGDGRGHVAVAVGHSPYPSSLPMNCVIRKNGGQCQQVFPLQKAAAK